MDMISTSGFLYCLVNVPKFVTAVNYIVSATKKVSDTELKTPQSFLVPVVCITFILYRCESVRACAPLHTCIYRVSHGTSVELQDVI
jgi:hypothetical protein